MNSSKRMNDDSHSTHIELDGYSSASSSYADFGDTGEVDEDEAKNADLINIKEISSDSDDAMGFDDDGPFPPTSLVLRLNPNIHPEAISWLVQKITTKKQHGGAELLVRCEPFTGRSGKGVVLHVTASILRFLEVAEFLELKKEDDTGYKREFRVRDLDSFVHGDILLETLITPAEKEVIVLYELENIRALPGEAHVPGYPGFILHSRQSILHVYITEHLIDSYYPLHDEMELSKLLKTNWFWAFWEPEPFEALRRYFGEAITLYFTFNAYYTTALILPSILSIILFFVPVNYILKLWRRKCSELAYIWGTLKMSRWEEPRLEYRGKMSIDPVTGKYVPKYPWWKTGVKVYLASLPLVILCMAGAFVVMLQYFKAEELLIPTKKLYKGTWTGIVIEFTPSVIYATLVALMTHYYRKFASLLTEWENHRTQVQFDKHRVGKLVLFEFVNNFMSFIYTGFYIQNTDKLQRQLLVILVTLHVIVTLQEAILPLFIRKTSAKMKEFLDRHQPSTIKFRLLKIRETNTAPMASVVSKSHWIPTNFGLDALDSSDPRIEMSRVEGEMDPYMGSFDDYLQLFIQFGYVFLFSPVFPVSVAIAAATNVFLIWASVFKLCQVFQRPIPRRIRDIGTWQVAFELMGFLSVMTNCGLIAVNPELQQITWFKNRTPIEIFFIIIIAEHLLIGIKLAFSKIVPNVPYWVKIAVARIEYKSQMALKKEQQLKSRRRLTLQFQAINMKLRDMDDRSSTSVLRAEANISKKADSNRPREGSTGTNQRKSK